MLAIVGAISASGDKDSYQLTIPANTSVQMELTMPLAQDYVLNLHNSAGTSIVWADDGGNGAPEAIKWTNTSSSAVVLYAQVRGYYSTSYSTTPYALLVSW